MSRVLFKGCEADLAGDVLASVVVVSRLLIWKGTASSIMSLKRIWVEQGPWTSRFASNSSQTFHLRL